MRYVIKNPSLGFFTEFQVETSTPILAPMDMVIHAGHPPVKKGEQIGTDYTYAPKFEAFKPSQAVQFDTEADALAQIANCGADGKPDAAMGGAEAFEGCVVVGSTAS